MKRHIIEIRGGVSAVLALMLLLLLSISGCASSLKTAEIVAINQAREGESCYLWAGDRIAVKFFYDEGLNDEVTIRPDGKVSLQLIGEIQAAGLTPSQFEALLRHEYSKVLYAGEVPHGEGSDEQGVYEDHAAKDFLTVGSTIAVKFFYTPELNDEVVIRPDGKISLQLVDEIKAAGLTPQQLDSLLTREYAKVLYAGEVLKSDPEPDDAGSSSGEKAGRSEYILAVGNKVAIDFAYDDDLDQEVVIRPDGKISLKQIDEIQAAGLTPGQLDSLLTREYAKVLYAEGVNEGEAEGWQLDPVDTLLECQYVLSVGSSIAVKFFYNDELNEEVVIRPDGMISLQRIGDVKAAGLTAAALAKLLKERYSEFVDSAEVAVIVKDFKKPDLTVIVKDFKVPELTVVANDIKVPEVTVTVTNSAAQKVYVGGEVARPGMIPISGMLRIHDSVIGAGGALETADLERAVVIRYNGSPEPEVYSVNLTKVMRGKLPDMKLKPYDVVYLPKTAIAEVNTLAKQYIHGLIPVNFNLVYNLNPELSVHSD